MSLWGKNDAKTNAPKHKNIVATSSARGNTMYQNATPSAFTANMIATVYGVDAAEAAIARAGALGATTPGWVVHRTGGGPVLEVTVTNGIFANGETAGLSNGSSNGIVTLTTNATSNLVSGVITVGGVFYTNTNVVAAFHRQKRMSGFVITSNATAIGYTNGDIITGSNGSINATANITTNTTGGITSTTVTNVGLFANTQANNTVVIAVTAANGSATTGNTASTVFAANLVASTGGTITVGRLGGRAGRVTQETLAVVRIATSNTSDDTIYPDT